MVRSFVITADPDGINWYDYNRDWRYTSSVGANFHQVIKDSFSMISKYNSQGESTGQIIFIKSNHIDGNKRHANLYYDITSVRQVNVPEPTSLAIFVLGIIALTSRHPIKTVKPQFHAPPENAGLK